MATPLDDVAVLTVPELGRALKVSESMAEKLVRTRQIESVKIERCRRVPVAAVVAYLERKLKENAGAA